MTDTLNNTNNTASALDASDMKWRNLALQFDDQRMKAIWHLRRLRDDPEGHLAAVDQFLQEAPLSGEVVLDQRIRAIVAERQAQIDVPSP